MTGNRYVGSFLVRVCTVALGVASVGLMVLDDMGVPYAFYGAVAGGVLTFVGLIHSFDALFRHWIRFAEVLQAVAVTTIFGVCYMLVVPLFGAIIWFRDPLRLRRRRQGSSWVTRRAEIDPLSLERMG
jgi:hypothetical protein